METTREFRFYDPRLEFTQAGKMIVRVTTTTTFLILGALTVILLLSDVSNLKFLGWFLVLFWLDFLVHFRKGRLEIEDIPSKGLVNVADFLRPSALDILSTATSRGRIAKTHFGLSVIEEAIRKPKMQRAIIRLDVDPREFQGKLHSLLAEFQQGGEADESWDEFQSPEFLENLMDFAWSRGANYIEPGDIMAAFLKMHDHRIERLRQSFAINEGYLRSALMLESTHIKPPSIFKKPRRRLESNVVNKAWTSRPTPQLDSLGEDLTAQAMAGRGRMLFGHKTEYRLMVEGLLKTVGPNVLLVGAAGSGKSALVEHLAWEMVSGKTSEPLSDMRLVTLDVGRLTAGAEPGIIQERLEALVQEVLTAGNIAIAIPDIHTLFKTSGEGHVSAAETLLPILENDNFPVIGMTTPEDFSRSLSPHDSFVRVFEKITVDEIEEKAAETFLTSEAVMFEARTGVVITAPALRSAVTMAKSHLRPKILPGSAVELLGHALDIAKRKNEKQLHSNHIYTAVEELTKVPVKAPSKEESKELLELENKIHQRFIGQEEAVKAVADALREYRSGLTREGGPIASFLFVGPTGVGKTQLAKLLADIQFGSEQAMIRFDMSEYQDKQSVFQFIGSPDGSLPGALTEAVRNKPHAILLFDEFEKAFSDIHNLFLQILDDARLTDTLGRTVDFKETIIIATSNAHSEKIAEALRTGKTIADISADFKNTLTDVFKPELVNRFSKIIVFKNLEQTEIEKIAVIHLNKFTESLKSKNIELEISPETVKAIARWGYDPTFGARPLDRTIEEKLRAPLAQFLLANDIQPGTVIEVRLEEGKVSFSLGRELIKA